MDGAALASILHVPGHPSPSHHSHPIVVVPLLMSNCCPRFAAIVFIDIVAISGGDGIIAVANAIAVAVCCPIIIVLLLLFNRHP